MPVQNVFHGPQITAESLAGIQGTFFHNYSRKKCPGYKPVFQLVDRREEDAPLSEGIATSSLTLVSSSSDSEEMRLQKERDRLICESEWDWKMSHGKSGNQEYEDGEKGQEELDGTGAGLPSADAEDTDDEE